jgi:hypothetical protein
MTRLKFITIVLAMLILISAILISGLLNGVARGDDGEPCDECQQYTIMKPSPETLQRWVEAYNSAPTAPLTASGAQLPSPTASLDLIDHLEYTPSERDQGYCGNCWAWAGTGVMEIALDVQNGIKDRLSIQYLNSNYNGGSGSDWACCGGRLTDLAAFYTDTGQAIPWSNTNADWQDGSRQCSDGSTSVSAGSISTTPYYTITSIEAQTIPTLPIDGVTDEATAIANIKNIFAQNKAVSFTYFMATDDDWNDFIDFWVNQDETAIWNPDSSCGNTADAGFGGHSVLCVGYNDDPGTDNDYWIMVNSWGTTSDRPDGLFRLDMHMNYDCYFYDPYPDGYYSFYWETLAITYSTPQTAINIVGKDSDDAVSQITFPPGPTGATVSNPFNNVDTFTDPQLLSGSDSEPVVRLSNTSGGPLLVRLQIDGWTGGVVASEDYELVATGTDNVNVVDKELSSDGSGNTVNTGETIPNGGYLDLYLEVVLGGSEGLSGGSTLTILGESP